MSKAVESGHPRTRHPLERLAAWQLVCVFAVVALIWLHEILDFPALFFGAKPTPVDFVSASTLSGFVLFFGVAATLPIHIHRKKNANESITICSYCRRVQIDEETWDQIETFFAKKTSAMYSHGVCPDCCSKVMSAYRNGKKDAGAREPLPTEVLV